MQKPVSLRAPDNVHSVGILRVKQVMWVKFMWVQAVCSYKDKVSWVKTVHSHKGNLCL